MRKIEKKMVEAVKLNKYFNEKNTKVVPINDDECEIYLFNKHIATKKINRTIGTNHDYNIWVNTKTLSDWPTVTTVSRLRALGVCVRVCQYQVMLDHEYQL